jgi:hypothetical protein
MDHPDPIVCATFQHGCRKAATAMRPTLELYNLPSSP